MADQGDGPERPAQMNAAQFWQAVLGDLQVRLPRNAFENWLRPTTVVGFDDDVVTVAAANTFGASTLQARYTAQVESVLKEHANRPMRVRFVVLNAGSPAPVDASAVDPPPAPDRASTRALFDDRAAVDGRAPMPPPPGPRLSLIHI